MDNNLLQIDLESNFTGKEVSILIQKAIKQERERIAQERIDRYDTTTIQEILSDEQERIVSETAGLSYPWGESDPGYRRGWDSAMKAAARIARNGR